MPHAANFVDLFEGLYCEQSVYESSCPPDSFLISLNPTSFVFNSIIKLLSLK